MESDHQLVLSILLVLFLQPAWLPAVAALVPRAGQVVQLVQLVQQAAVQLRRPVARLPELRLLLLLLSPAHVPDA